MNTLVMRMVLLCCFGTALTGCGWSDKETWRGAVWSDDDSAVSAVHVSYEAKTNVWSLGSADYERNHRSQLYVVDVESGERSPVGEEERGEIAEQFYMKQEGYILYKVHPERFTLSESGTEVFKRLDLVTGVAREVERVTDVRGVSCDGMGYSSGIPKLALIPGPSGRIIARIDGVHECERVRVSLSFLDGETLNEIKNVGVVYEDVGEDATWIPFDFAWNVWGQFMIKAATDDVVGYAPEYEDRVWGEVGFDCFFPRTTSSQSNFNGEYVWYREGGIETSRDGSVFGCDELEP